MIWWLVCILGCSVEQWLLAPSVGFDPVAVPAAPDYADPTAWAALPETEDKADLAPEGLSQQQTIAPADAFFIHPTTFFSTDALNDPIAAGTPSQELLDMVVLSEEASALNACCRVYAPRYRQATIGVFYSPLADAAGALEVAYQDVDRAFTAFLERRGPDRPFVIGAHSQGSLHAMRLLERIDADPALRSRLVVAYIPGFAHPRRRFVDTYQHLRPCDTPTQTRCIAAWDTYREGARTRGTDTLRYWQNDELVELDIEAVHCTNPITWTDHETRSPLLAHKGAIEVINDGADYGFLTVLRADEPLGINITGLQPPQPALVQARCHTGFLEVNDLSSTGLAVSETTPGNHHLHDWSLFGMDIRVNAWMRVIAYKGEQAELE